MLNRIKKNLKLRVTVNNAGFTLMELLIVISIIGVLATFTVVNFMSVKQRGRDTQRKADVKQIQTAIEVYRADQGAYPPAPLPACGSPLVFGAATYMKKIPCDPLNTGQNVYSYATTGDTYTITACLENVNDNQKDATNNNITCAGGATNWSFTVTNP